MYNCEQYIRAAIESVISDEGLGVEIVVVDNASTDSTVSIVREFMNNAKGRIRLYVNDRNIGMAGNFNRCLEYAGGTYIKFLMADDILLPGCIEKLSGILDANPGVSLVASARLIINESGDRLTTSRRFKEDIEIPGVEVINDCLFGQNYIGEPTAVMFRKKDLRSGFNEHMPQVMDMDMWFKLLELGDLYYVTEPLCAIRHHANQMTHANVKSGALIEDNIKLFESYSHKSYIEYSLSRRLRHKLFITYRLWVSRKYVSEENRKNILSRYGSGLAYMLMPLGFLLLSFKRQASRLIRGAS
jgi:glycosyltransferase involved in cell wall biosynthesis